MRGLVSLNRSDPRHSLPRAFGDGEASLFAIRHDWTREEVRALFGLPFPDLMFQAQTVHRRHFDPHEVQISTLLSIKTGGCPEDCAYCPQSASYETGLAAEKLHEPRGGAGAGASRQGCRCQPLLHGRRLALRPRSAISIRSAPWCGACRRSGWRPAPRSACSRRPRRSGSRTRGSTTTTTTSIPRRNITARSSPRATYGDRLDTLAHVRDAGISVCCGGIVGMGEGARGSRRLDRNAGELGPHPESVPINMLVRVAGTPLAGGETLDPIDFVRTIAVARITMPASVVRLSAGREDMSARPRRSASSPAPTRSSMGRSF